MPGHARGPGSRGAWLAGFGEEWDGETTANVDGGRDEARELHPQSFWPGNRLELLCPDTNGKSLPAPRKKLLLKARYARAYREGEKWYEIRRVSGKHCLCRPGHPATF